MTTPLKDSPSSSKTLTLGRVVKYVAMPCVYAARCMHEGRALWREGKRLKGMRQMLWGGSVAIVTGAGYAVGTGLLTAAAIGGTPLLTGVAVTSVTGGLIVAGVGALTAACVAGASLLIMRDIEKKENKKILAQQGISVSSPERKKENPLLRGIKLVGRGIYYPFKKSGKIMYNGMQDCRAGHWGRGIGKMIGGFGLGLVAGAAYGALAFTGVGLAAGGVTTAGVVAGVALGVAAGGFVAPVAALAADEVVEKPVSLTKERIASPTPGDPGLTSLSEAYQEHQQAMLQKATAEGRAEALPLQDIRKAPTLADAVINKPQNSPEAQPRPSTTKK